MLTVPDSVRIFVACDPVDFRRQFDGLAAIARDDLGLDPLSGALFVFFNKRRESDQAAGVPAHGLLAALQAPRSRHV